MAVIFLVTVQSSVWFQFPQCSESKKHFYKWSYPRTRTALKIPWRSLKSQIHAVNYERNGLNPQFKLNINRAFKTIVQLKCREENTNIKSDLRVFRDNMGSLRGIITDDKEILRFVQKTISSHSLQSERICLEILRNLLQNFSKSSTVI